MYLTALSYSLQVKMENQNPGRSVKDRAAKHIIEDAMKTNKLKKGGRLYESTSGSTGISLGLMCNLLGIKTEIFLNDDLAKEKYNILELIGCQLHKVPSLNIIDNGNFIKTGKKAAEEDPNGFFANQFHNKSNFKGHFQDTGPEIYDQMKGDLDYFVAGSGTGATIAGVSRFLKSKNPNIKAILADPQGSCLHRKVKYGVAFNLRDKEGYKERSPFRTMVEGIGLGFLTQNFDLAAIDDSYSITDQEAYQVAMYLIKHEGLFIGSSSAVHIAAALKLAKKAKKGSKIVTLVCDDGLRHISKFYNRDFWEEKGFKFVDPEEETLEVLKFDN